MAGIRISGQKRLVIVDDEPNICRALQRLLRHDGYDILATTDVDEALDRVKSTPIDVVISDQRMPSCKGTEFLATVQSVRPETVRIILSGYSDLPEVAAAMSAGAINKFLTKPWDDGLLRADVREAFARAHSVKELTRDAFSDPDTGMPTIEVLKSVFDELRDEAVVRGTVICVFYLAMWQLENVRSAYGQEAAARLLRSAGEKLRATLGAGNQLVRYGDGFVLLVDALEPDDRLSVVTERLSQIEAEKVEVNADLSIRPVFGIGCSYDFQNQEAVRR